MQHFHMLPKDGLQIVSLALSNSLVNATSMFTKHLAWAKHKPRYWVYYSKRGTHGIYLHDF